MPNKENIFDLVEKHFGLDEKSLGIFKSKLFDNKDVAVEYKKYLGDDTRRYFKIEDDIKERIDEGWSYFSSEFRSFCRDNGTTYQEFKNNAFSFNGKKQRMLKALKEYYLDPKNPTRLIDDLSRSISPEYFKELFFGTERSVNVFFISGITYENGRYSIRYYDQKRKHKTLTKNVLKSKFVKFFSDIEKDFDTYLTSVSERIGTSKLPNKDIFVVLSVDFEDWFLCSTGEKWGSCLSLESNHDGAFWSGLPGLISDKNRAMVYITDMSKKTYNGIIVDHIISRSWLLVNKDSEVCFVGEYPSDMNLYDIANRVIFEDSLSEDEFDRSKYNFEPIFIGNEKKKFLSYIYEDTSQVMLEKKNDKFFCSLEEGRGKSDWIVYDNCDYRSTDEDDVFCFGRGISGLMNRKKKLTDFICFERDCGDD